MKDLYYYGQKFSLIDKTTDKNEMRSCMLVETWDSEYVFQIVCVKGYDAGKIMGYNKKQPENDKAGKMAIDKAHLVTELKRNMVFDEASLEIEST